MEPRLTDIPQHEQWRTAATPGPTRAQALVEFVCALVKLLIAGHKRDFGYC